MELSLSEAAHMLGKSDRQVRYLIKTGKLKADKKDGRWVLRSDDLPISKGQVKARARKASALRDAVDDSLSSHLGQGKRASWSVLALPGFGEGVGAARQAREALGTEHPAIRHLESALVALGRGGHCYHGQDKQAAYRQSREHASAAIVRLYLDGSDDAVAVASTLESELLPALAGLLRRLDKARSA